jgi:glutathione S-transferase
MKLFYSPTSPYARKCCVTAIEKGVEARIEIVAASPLSDPPELHAANPLGKVPALVLPDDRCIVDSRVICEHLDTLAATPRLIPTDHAARIDCRTREALADGISDAAFLRTMERLRPEAQRSPDWNARWANAIRRAIAGFETTIPDPPLPDNSTPDLGDIALVCALSYVDFRHGDLAWDREAPRLRAWLAAIEKRPSFAATTPPTA